MSFKAAKQWLLNEGRRRGLELEVLGSSQRQLEIDAVDGRAADFNLSTRGGVGVRVVVGGKVGYASTEDLAPEALAWTLDEAVENAELQPAGRAALPAGGALGRHDLLDEGLSAELAAKARAAVELHHGLAEDERVQSIQYARYSEGQIDVELGSTSGVDGSYRTGTAAVIAGLVMREGESVKQGFEYDAKGDFHQLEPGRTALRALAQIGRQLGARPLNTGRRRAIFEPQVVGSLLQLLSYALSGKTLAEGKSALAGKLGERIAAANVTLIDDATRHGGLASRPFDAEGTPSRPVVLIENGVFRSFLHNTDTAARTGQSTTGHAKRDYRSTLGVGPSNLILEPGSGISPGDGVLVTDLMGVHAGANPITGDVSVQAMGLETAGGETFPVDDFAVSFNLFELLLRVEEVGAEVLERPAAGGSSVIVPSIAVADVSFAGK